MYCIYSSLKIKSIIILQYLNQITYNILYFNFEHTTQHHFESINARCHLEVSLRTCSANSKQHLHGVKEEEHDE